MCWMKLPEGSVHLLVGPVELRELANVGKLGFWTSSCSPPTCAT
jgi:hypothetical protein